MSDKERNRAKRKQEIQREREREKLNLNLNLLLFYNGYKIGRLLLFIWPLNISNRLIN